MELAVRLGVLGQVPGAGAVDDLLGQLTEAGEGTEAELHSDVTVTGRAAAMGEGVIAGVTEGMINEFAENLAKI